MAAKDWLKERNLTDVFDSFPGLLYVSPTDTIAHVCQILCSHNIYAVPVIENGKALGLIDLNDLTTLLCQVFGDVTKENGLEKMGKAEEYAEQFLTRKASEAINLSGKNPYTPIRYTATLYDAVEKLVSGTQRLPVVDENDNILTIISPSLVIKYISHFLNDKAFAPIVSSKVAELPAKFVVSVDCATPVFIGLQQLNSSKTASLAITDEGQLISTFTLKDLKYLAAKEHFAKLFMEIGEYITEIRRSTPKSIFPAIHCSIDSTIESVLLRLAATGIHRMFVVVPNSPRSPVGVISLRDVLTVILAN